MRQCGRCAAGQLPGVMPHFNVFVDMPQKPEIWVCLSICPHLMPYPKSVDFSENGGGIRVRYTFIYLIKRKNIY